jgi:hypothetical protein
MVTKQIAPIGELTTDLLIQEDEPNSPFKAVRVAR